MNDNFRLTKKRKIILDVLEKATKPLTAFDILDIVQDSGTDIWISTIYRTLDKFEEEGLIEKADIPDSDSSYYLLKDKKHKHYGICLSCKKLVDIVGCPFHDQNLSMEDDSFEVTSHNLTVYGYCSDCKDKKE